MVLTKKTFLGLGGSGLGSLREYDPIGFGSHEKGRGRRERDEGEAGLGILFGKLLKIGFSSADRSNNNNNDEGGGKRKNHGEKRSRAKEDMIPQG